MGFLLYLLRLPFILLWLLSCLLTVATVYPLAPLAWRGRMNKAWSRALVWLCGVRVVVVGQPRMQGAALWVSNHVSWLDIFILAGVRELLFVAKSEIRAWPVIGWLVAKVGAVFLQRGQRHAIRQVGQDMQFHFKRGEVIGLFAEGTTSPGYDVLPFRSSLFEPAIRDQIEIQLIALHFYHHGRRSDFASFVGDETLVGNLWTLLRATGVVVQVEFLSVISASEAHEWGRIQVARHAEQVVREALSRNLSAPACGHQDAQR